MVEFLHRARAARSLRGNMLWKSCLTDDRVDFDRHTATPSSARTSTMNEHAESGTAHSGPSGKPKRDRDREPRRDRRQIAKLFEQLPPHAIEAEMSLLGSMLLDPAGRGGRGARGAGR